METTKGSLKKFRAFETCRPSCENTHFEQPEFSCQHTWAAVGTVLQIHGEYSSKWAGNFDDEKILDQLFRDQASLMALECEDVPAIYVQL